MTTKPDLRVRRECDTSYTHGHDHTGNPCQGWYWEPATAADLVAALIAEGGEIAETRPFGGKGLIEVEERGRYLVYGPIPVEEETAI